VTVHVVEPGGHGGVYQHTLAVAVALAGAGREVTLHTASDAECAGPSGVRYCGCVDWKRERPRGRRRTAAIAADYVRVTVPHLRASLGSKDTLHVQGLFGNPLTTLTLVAGKWRAARIVHSPHNTFSRGDRRHENFLLRRDARIVDATIVFSEADRRTLASWGADAIVSPLAQYMPDLDGWPARWRKRWDYADGRPTVLFAGQVRRDKQLDLLLAGAALRSDRWRVAVVGEDLGDGERCRRLAEELGVTVAWWDGYARLAEFVGALAAADVVVCPHTRASQSGVLALARQLGVRTVASRVGGLPELAGVTFAPGDANDLARSIDEALAAAPPAPHDPRAELLDVHLRAYGGAP
jgi:glycosyltransferase involved in cell wall biosynthesis